MPIKLGSSIQYIVPLTISHDGLNWTLFEKKNYHEVFISKMRPEEYTQQRNISTMI